ncbi:MAG: AmmeMemoRadiSam system protein B [Bacteroidetes bacterium]|nr:AmmeMemoRadiSam system protein B [Bacteroidota bacterium]
MNELNSPTSEIAHKFEHEAQTKNISVCGYSQIMVLIEFAKLTVPGPQISLLKRGHSGKVHPANEVVNYVSVMLHY